MGKKRERELRDTIDELSAQITREAQREVEARRKADVDMGAALKNMVDESFLIVTKSGYVLTGRATEVVMDQPTRNFSFDGKWLDVRPAGPKKYSASITIEPLK
jgi:hypothetical protein